MSRLLEDIAENVASPSNVEEAVTAEEPALPELALPEITGLDFDLDGLLSALDQHNGGEITSETVAKEWLVRVRPMPGAPTHVSTPLWLLRAVVDLGARSVHVDGDEVRALDAFNLASASLDWKYGVL